MSLIGSDIGALGTADGKTASGEALLFTPTSQILWVIDADGYIHPQADATVVLDNSNEVLVEGNPVGLWVKKTSGNLANQKWTNKNGVFYSQQDVSWALGADAHGNLVLTKTNPVTFQIPYAKHIVGQLGHPITVTDPITVYTAIAVVTPTSGAGGRIWDKITPGGNDGLLLDLYPGVNPRSIDSPSIVLDVAGNALTLNKRTHVAASFDGHVVNVYINGAKVATKSGGSALPQNKHPLLLGVDQAGNNKFAGNIERALFNFVALTDAQVLADYHTAQQQLGF